ncbi:MAG: hypothetical protein WEB30_08400 [Cyclobacteriaceae bacterium]
MGIREKTSEGIHKIKEEAKVLKGEKSKDKEYSSTREFIDEVSAKFEFSRAKERLYDVNGWSAIPGIANSVFELYSPDGQPVKRNYVEEGDFIKIDLPGPLPFYWVKVTALSDSENHAEFTVQPTYDPTEKDDKAVTDHFFQDQARSIFRVERKGRVLTAREIGLNEAINNQKEEAGEKGLINTLVSEAGWSALQKYQWKNLTDYLVGIRTPSR